MAKAAHPPHTDVPAPESIAAVDIGSNSFRLEIAVMENDRLKRVDYLKETVRLGSGLNERRMLMPEAMRPALECVSRFAARLEGFAPHQVRAVATQTLREALNRDEFISSASFLLGFDIDIISGPEEARLIYLGVSHLLPPSDETRLVIDIGGRSTEIILGQGVTPHTVTSLRTGSVSWSQRFFPDGSLGQDAFSQAALAARAKFDEAAQNFPRDAWQTAYGSSGTVSAVAEILAARGEPAGQITRQALQALRDDMVAAGHIDKLALKRLRENRRAVIAGGVSVLLAALESLRVDTLFVAQGALRHGVMYDLLERRQPATDPREACVRTLMQRFRVDTAQAARVGTTATWLFDMLVAVDKKADATELAHLREQLLHAAQLHEIGCYISHDWSNHHGAYILDHSDTTGFTQPELQGLAQLVLGQRENLHKHNLDLGSHWRVAQLVCLRLALALCNARRDPALETIRLTYRAGVFRFKIDAAKAGTSAQTIWLLQREPHNWSKTPWSLEVSTDRKNKNRDK